VDAPVKNNPISAFCGAKNRKGEFCKLPSGWGTEHKGKGRCRLHGGCSTGPPKGSKNALKTGKHETIFLDQLDEDEREIWGAIDVAPMAQVDQEIRLLDIRIRRMLMRIQKLKDHEYTVVEMSEESGSGVQGFTTKESSKRLGTLGQIQTIERDLTDVQAKKAKLIQLKEQLLCASGGDHPDLSDYFNALSGVACTVWNDDGSD
jgi:uncharacterized protein YjcR